MGLKNYFIGDAFEDSLFNTDDQQREKACSWKIQSNTLLFSGLTNDYWRWRAVGIPLDLSDKSLEGDIDLMFAMRHRSQDRDGPARFANIYRGFELKTAKVKKSGEVKSLKDGRFKKTIAQLQKLCDFGLPQFFCWRHLLLRRDTHRHRREGCRPKYAIQSRTSERKSKIRISDT